MLRLLIVCLALCGCKTTSVIDPQIPLTEDEFTYHQLSIDKDTLPYRVLLPQNFNKSKAYPLMLFLHGAGERGSDNELQLVHGSDLFLKAETRKEYPAIVVFPQCAVDSTWSGYTWLEDGTLNYNSSKIQNSPVVHQKLVKALIAELNQNYKLDHNRFYIGGLSMGGMGTFETVRNNPKLFAAAFPICGGAHPSIAAQLSTPKWWIFHGEDDEVVLPENSKLIYEAIKALGADVKLSLYPGVGHDSWTNAFEEPELLEWLFEQKLAN